MVLEGVLCGPAMVKNWCPLVVGCNCSLFLYLILEVHCMLWNLGPVYHWLL